MSADLKRGSLTDIIRVPFSRGSEARPMLRRATGGGAEPVGRGDESAATHLTSRVCSSTLQGCRKSGPGPELCEKTLFDN